MDLNLTGKSVIVTASSKGLGKATALEFAREGAHVLLSSRNAAELRDAVNEIKTQTGNSHVDYTVCDVKEPDQIKNLVQKAVDWNGTIDVLINNTGGPPAGDFTSFQDEDWQNAFELTLFSYIRTIREVLPYMQKQQSGHIVNVASSSIKQSLDHLLLSNTFRPAVAGLAKSLSQELGKDNILINTVGPGRIETTRILELDTLKAKESGVTLEQLQETNNKNIPLNRTGKPEEFAKTVVFLASGANSYITGQSLIVDGGLVRAL